MRYLTQIITESRGTVKRNLHGTPIFLIHDRENVLNEDTDSTSHENMMRALENYPNQNQHLHPNVISDTSEIAAHHVDGVLRRHYDLRPDYKHSLFRHTIESKSINKHLWNLHNDPVWTQTSPEYEKRISDLDDALGRIEVPAGGLKTFSGLSRTDPLAESMKHPERKLFFPAYTSTSIKPTIAGTFAKDNIQSNPHLHGITPGMKFLHHIIKFHFPEGSRSGAYVAPISRFENEKEFITRRGMSVKIDPNAEDLEYNGSSGQKIGKIRIWNAHVVGFHHN